MPFDPNYVQQFQGISLPALDRARQQNALGAIQLQLKQQQAQGLQNPNSTPEQLARSGNVDVANAIAEQQQVARQNASRYVGTRLLTVKTVKDMQALAQDPNFVAGATAIGLPHPGQIDDFSKATDEQVRQQATELARAMGVAPPAEGYTLGEGQVRFDAQGRQIAAGPTKESTIPAGYRKNAEGTGLEAIPGGPADKSRIGSLLTAEGLDLAAQEYLNTGKLPAGLGKDSSGTNAKIISRSAEIAAANGDDAKAAALRRAGFVASKTALAKLTSQRTLVGAFERTALKNLEIALAESQKVDRTGVPVLNRWLLAGKKSIGGDVEVGRFHAALTSALNEYAKVLSGATGAAGISDAARKEAESLLSTANTPDQVAGIIDIMKREMANREAGFAEQEAQLQESMTGRPNVGVAPAATSAPAAPGAPAGTAAPGQWKIERVQ